MNVEANKQGVRSDRSPVITCQYHRYGDTWAEYFYGLMNIRKDYDYISTLLVNYTAPDKGPKVPCICMFNELIQLIPYPEYIELLSNALINVDVTYDYTYGRGIIEAAALKVPTVGSETIEASDYLFPELSVVPGNDMEMEHMEVAQQGFERSDHYNLENSYKRMVEAIEDCENE